MKFRISEYQIPNSYGHRFGVEIGTEIKEKIWWIFYRKKTVWTEVMREDNKTVALTFKTFDEAAKMVNDIKMTIPKYTNIL